MVHTYLIEELQGQNFEVLNYESKSAHSDVLNITPFWANNKTPALIIGLF